MVAAHWVDEKGNVLLKECLMYGKKNNEPVSVAIIDHPSNVGYPCYWNARGYGLFAANPIGRLAYGATEGLNFSLLPAQSATFRYRVIISHGVIPTAETLNNWAAAFGK